MSQSDLSAIITYLLAYLLIYLLTYDYRPRTRKRRRRRKRRKRRKKARLTRLQQRKRPRPRQRRRLQRRPSMKNPRRKSATSSLFSTSHRSKSSKRFVAFPTSFYLIYIFAARCYASAALAVMRCPSVCLSRSYILSKRINISAIFFANVGVECR